MKNVLQFSLWMAFVAVLIGSASAYMGNPRIVGPDAVISAGTALAKMGDSITLTGQWKYAYIPTNEFTNYNQAISPSDCISWSVCLSNGGGVASGTGFSPGSSGVNPVYFTATSGGEYKVELVAYSPLFHINQTNILYVTEFHADIVTDAVVVAAGTTNIPFPLCPERYGSMSWTLTPEIGGGAAFASTSDDGATVDAGTLGTSYVVKVVATDYTNCWDTAALTVITNFTIVASSRYIALSNTVTATAWTVDGNGAAVKTNSDWSIVAGDTKVEFVGNTTGVDTVTIRGIAASATTNDVKIHAVASGAPTLMDDEWFTVLEVELKSISFVDAGAGNGGENEHTLYENADPDEWGDDTAIADPVWVADGPDADSDPDKNNPVCYTRSKATTQSKASVDVVVRAEPAGQIFYLVGMDGTTEYFRRDGITSTGGDQAVTSIVALVALPTTLEKLSKAFTWKVVFTTPDPGLECQAGESTHTIYTVYDTPITTVEGQDNKPTPKRLDFDIVGVAAGQSNKVTICDKIVEKVLSMTGDSYGGMLENPRWEFYANPPDRDLDCHHRAALAASGFGVVGIQGYVHRVYATCYPVPTNTPAGYTNSTVNDYVGSYTTDRFKKRVVSGSTQTLKFEGNNFEGCVRVEDGSADDGNAWWTVWPRLQHDTAKALLIWYDSAAPSSCPHGGYYQYWTGTDPHTDHVPVPAGSLADTPKILGGPD